MNDVKLIISPRYQRFQALTFAKWRIIIKANGSNDNHYYLDETIFYTTMVRLSKQREAILRVLKSTTSHPTADWVYEQVRKEIPRISLGTVYRNLRLLAQEGSILQLDFAGAPSRFDTNIQPHAHFLCERCGRIFDVAEPVYKEIDERVARKTGLEILNHRLEFSGICKDCQSEISQGKLL
ncbi:MAG: transcriptional repressor [Dehalococcoidales bacterium]